uniref:NIMA related kinase 10 n=1 Tax=Latimeria chalumnae TaxID=7897 RepID=H3AK26_LATCH
MELIEGAPLAEHFNSLKEKQQQFAEERIWNIFIQICLALRYLHKEKRIVHRDLTPNNVMLGEKDKVTITDFGLAKQKQENSKLTSVVGTILYSCPEVVKSEPYGEKADVWAAGCLLYQMATLNPPFYSSNMLSLATKIVEAVYEPIPQNVYSEKLINTIKRCLTPDAETRPDIVEVSSMISDMMMKNMDGLSMSQLVLEKKLERERRRTQRYFMEASKNPVTYHHQLNLLSHEPDIKSSLGNSQGAGSFKNESSEMADMPSEAFQTDLFKDEDKPSDEAFPVNNYAAENTEKDVCSELDDDLNISDNSISPSHSPSKDSGLGTMKRSISVSGEERQNAAGSGDFLGGPNMKPRPVFLILVQCLQLPPALHHNIKRRVIERFKKSLFSPQSNPCNLKVEIKKLLQGSPELIEPYSFMADFNWLHHSSRMSTLVPDDRAAIAANLEYEEGVTYEQMQTMIEDVLEESGYYNVASNV